MSFFIVSFVRSPKHLKYFLAAFLLACLKMGQEGLIGKITGNLIWENQEIMRLHGSTPNYTHPNSFAGMALGTLPFLYYLWPLSNKYIKLLLLLIGLLSLNIVIYTGSRTGYIGLLAFIGYIFILSNNKNKFLVRFILLSFLALPLIPSQYIGRFDSTFADKENEGGSIRTRKEILKDAMQIFVENPFGVGVAAFPKKRMDTFSRMQDTHNLYLEIATNLGFQGLIIVGLLIYKLLTTLYRIKSLSANLINNICNDGRQCSNLFLDDLRLIEAVALATSAFVVIRLALGLFGMDLYEIYWWFAIGITLSLYSMMNKVQIAIDKYGLQTSCCETLDN
jgi:O-antigen ligase